MRFYRLSNVISFFAVIFYCNLIQSEECCIDTFCEESRGYSFNFNASYLYWGVQADQLGFAIENLSVLQPGTTQLQSKIKTHSPKWNSGVRLEAGLYNNCNSIGCRIGWTNFQSKSNASAQSQSQLPSVGVTTIAAFLGDAPFLVSQSAKSQWDIKVNEFTFDLTYLGSCDSCFSFCPYVGIMGAIIDQKQKIAYTGIPNNETTIDLSISRKNDFHGIGPRFGVGFNWHFCDGLSLIANANASYFIGKFNTKNNISAPNDLSPSFYNINEKIRRGRPMASGLVGLEWKQQMNNCIALSIFVAYEFQYWWQQWHSASNVLNGLITGEGQWGDLSMHGLVVSAGISF